MSEWRPIETVPRDGTRILVCEADGQMYVTSWPAGSSERWFVDHGDPEEWWGDIDNPLTHWMPLPERPATPQGEH